MSKYKMIVTDLDETLLQANGDLSLVNEQAIKRAINAGTIFVPNTGRAFDSIQPLLSQIGLINKRDNFVISFNGGATVENFKNNVQICHPLSDSVAERIFKIGLGFRGTSAHINTLDQMFAYGVGPDEKHYLQTRGVFYQNLSEPDIKQIGNRTIMKVIFNHSDPEIRTKVHDAVLAELKGQVVATYSSNRYVEFNPFGVNKGTATLELAQKLGIKPSEVIAVGDNFNDLPMIEKAGLGICVSNGRDEVKKIANYVTEADNDHGAIAEIINKFILN